MLYFNAAILGFAQAAVSAVIHNDTTASAFGPPIMLVNYGGCGRMEVLEHADGVFSEEGESFAIHLLFLIHLLVGFPRENDSNFACW